MDIVFEHYEPAEEPHRESLCALGNGVLFMRASAPEADRHHPSHYAGLYHAGGYDAAPRVVDGQPAAVAVICKLPNPLGLSFRAVDGHWFRLEAVRLVAYRQSLNLRDGLLQRELLFHDRDGRRTQLCETRFVSMAEPQLIGLRWELRALNWGGEIECRSALDGGVVNAKVERNRAYEGRRLHDVGHRVVDAETIELDAHLAQPRRRVVLRQRTSVAGAERLGRHVEADDDRAADLRRCLAAAGTTIVIDKLVDVRLHDEAAAPSGECSAGLADGFEPALARHRAAWQVLWERCGGEAAQPALERALQLHRFHLLQTISPHSAAHDVGLPARGWQEMYYGQVFWDDLLAMPFYSSRFPEAARGLLMYRYRRLDAARAAARATGLRGAMYPWRSAGSGAEETPPLQLNPLSGRWMRDHTPLQRHIGCAIAFNLRQYALVSGDEAFIANEGGEMLLEIARFWASAAQWDARRERYVIVGVVGPDEYHNAYPHAAAPGLDNNAYTNVMATWTLAFALDLLARLPGEAAQRLRERLQLDDAELQHWDRVSRRLHVPLIDTESGPVIGQFDRFETLRPYPRELLHARQAGERADWLLEARGDTADAYQVTKQADVLMLMHLLSPEALADLFARLGYAFDAALCRRTADYYLARITHESSLSRISCAGALVHHDSEASWHYYCAALDVDIGSDGKTADGLHMGAMAGSLDVLQRLYLGLNFDVDGLRLLPAPPRALGDVWLPFRYRGGEFRIALDGETLQLDAMPDNAAAVGVCFRDEPRRLLRPGERLRWPLDRAGEPVWRERRHRRHHG